MDIREDETLEELQLCGFRLIQKKNSFRFGVDAVLLADFARIRQTDSAADFGTGSGILPLLLLGRNKGQMIHALEINGEMAELAERNMLLNGVEKKVQVLHADARRASAVIHPGSIDAIVCNPPYGVPGRHPASENARLAEARHQQKNALSDLLKAAYCILRGRGRISIIYPADQMLDLMVALRAHDLEPKRFRLVYPYASSAARLVLVEGVKSARPTLQPQPPLILYEPDGRYTDELKSIYHMRE